MTGHEATETEDEEEETGDEEEGSYKSIQSEGWSVRTLSNVIHVALYLLRHVERLNLAKVNFNNSLCWDVLNTTLLQTNV